MERGSGPPGRAVNGEVAIIVLGAAVRADGTASAAMVRRVRHAAGLARDMPGAVVVLSGGQGKRHPPDAPPEARLMADLAIREGVAPEALILEPRSRDTFGNARHSLALLEGRAIRQIRLVTDRPHLRRALWCFRRVGRARGLAVDIAGAGVPIPDRRVAALAHVREVFALLIYAARLRRRAVLAASPGDAHDGVTHVPGRTNTADANHRPPASAGRDSHS
ncbi:YdcF family protein [Rhodospira trueperi]|uniref:DUF218 domain-containing protein n=1 Tax=Rhodospira trueperi TaxID=69960 RepID=A0A1G6YXL5_9PROT|nr:YdcF family protein [Rhodospira trueperi]SDD94377.1 DUF218 domain-containing protein [Rhodospira trueperi]